MTEQLPILESFELSSQWPTFDPFLFCAHHDDNYPRGNQILGPDASLDSHQIGQDFEHADGWNMYHGSVVPGFPQHPHRGFETISYMRRGVMDHADSLGSVARLGRGDVQWMTTGRGVQHSEMFPLLNRNKENPLELFQIWLNLPASDKLVEPYFTMLWNEDLPRHQAVDTAGRASEVVVIAGEFSGVQPPIPPTNSWAARRESDLAVWHVRLDPDATWIMPTARDRTDRAIYLFEGDSIRLKESELLPNNGARLDPSQEIVVTASETGAEFIVLQGRPIGEPIARYGPFVMNTQQEIEQAFGDYHRHQFGGWPWPNDSPNHGPNRGRFAVHANGMIENERAISD